MARVAAAAGRARRRRQRSAVLAALPEFLIAAVLASVSACSWAGCPRWAGTGRRGWSCPRSPSACPPAPFSDGCWTTCCPPRSTSRGRWPPPPADPAEAVARQALRRCTPGLLPNLGLFVVGLTGGAVAIEQIFDIPGLGRLTLQAALAQDLPVLQTGTLALVLLAALAGVLARLAARLLIGPALRDGALHSLHRPTAHAPRTLPLLYGALLLTVVGLGLPRDPLFLETGARLQAPSWGHPFGTDALGRDILTRIAHGALNTLGIALAVSAAALVAGVLLGLLPRLSGPLVDTVNAVPPVLAALLVTGIAGSGPWTPALAVAAVAWSPLATHTAAMLQQERATTHLTATRALGAGRWYLLRHELLPAVLPPVTRHALLRLPGVALSPGRARLPRPGRPAALPRVGPVAGREPALRRARPLGRPRPRRRPCSAGRARRHRCGRRAPAPAAAQASTGARPGPPAPHIPPVAQPSRQDTALTPVSASPIETP